MAIITKKRLKEIIDDEGNLIGTEDLPQTGSNKETEAGHTTDYNARVHGQNFKNDFLGRFGFYFYESDGENKKVEDTLAKIMYEKYKETLKHYHENPEKIHSDYELHQSVDFDSQPEGSREHDYEWAADILKVIEPHMKKDINEAKVVEDKLTDKKSDNDIVKKDKKDIGKKVERVADLLSKLPKNDLDKLMSLLESKKSKNVSIPDGLKKKMKEVSLGKDEDGYYVYTHRARSKSYESPEKIPDSKIKYISSTG